MNVLIVGNNEVNGYLGQRLLDEGFTSDVIEDGGDIVRVRRDGEGFAVSTKADVYKASAVIITEKPEMEGAEFFDTKALNLSDAGTFEKLMAIKGRARIVFLLDYLEESAEYLTVEALDMALALANAKKEVLFLSMFVKGAGDGVEKLFQEARKAGVSFVRYEDVDIDFSEEQGVYKIKVFDGVFDTGVETPYLVTAGEANGAALAGLGRKFRLSGGGKDEGIESEFRYFLNPGLTTRKGVYYYAPGLSGIDAKEGVDKNLPLIISDIRQLGKTGAGGAYAYVDPKKCAFCYSCYRVCPHAALEPDVANSAMACVESACMACGACAAICPGEAIVMKGEDAGLTFDTVSAGKAAGCKVFCCENSAGPALAGIIKGLGEDGAKLSLTEIPCGGRLGGDVISAALATYGKVLLAVCIDDACRHMDGGRRACRQAERAIAMLEKSGLNEKQVKCIKVSHAMPEVLAENVKAFLED